MSDTKERILIESLRLFAQSGYEAVSVKEIADRLSLTKGALYRHYQSKRKIFDNVVERMAQMDFDRAEQYQMPEGTFAEMANAYGHTPLEMIQAYSKAQFRYWTEEEFPSLFRKLLTLEQYHSSEMAQLYQQYLAAGPVGYMEDLFGEMAGCQHCSTSPKQLALAFYAPIYLLISIYDSALDKEEITALAEDHIDRFMQNLLKQ